MTNQAPLVILTTPHSEHAIDNCELIVVDYLIQVGLYWKQSRYLTECILNSFARYGNHIFLPGLMLSHGTIKIFADVKKLIFSLSL